MYLAKVTFGKIPAGMEIDEIEHTLLDYLFTIRKTGQICSDPLVSISNGEGVGYAYLSRPDAYLRQFHGRYGLSELEKLETLFGQTPIWQLLDDNIPTEFPTLSGANTFCLSAPEYNGLSPIQILDSGELIPLYQLPLDDDQREQLYFWASNYSRMLGIWLASRALEIEAYEQMASPQSALSQHGQELARLVESAVNKPVYYFLMRYYARLEGEENRKCPSCGNDWRNLNYDVANDTSGFFFQCDPCRLVSEIGNSADEEEQEYASIGEYQSK